MLPIPTPVSDFVDNTQYSHASPETEQILTENSVVDVELDVAAAADVLP